MRNFAIFSVLLVLVSLASPPSQARPPARCSAVAVSEVKAEETPEAVLKKGSRDYGPITQVRVNRKTGRMVYCAHGSYCYAASAIQISSPCTISPMDFDDPDDFYFSAD